MLDERHISSFLDLTFPDLDPAERERVADRLADPERRAQIFVALDALGENVLSSLRFAPITADHLQLVGPASVDDHASRARELLAPAIEFGKSMVSMITTRPIVGQVTDDYCRTLEDLGFENQGERVEFRSPVDRLPTEDGTPLTFRTMGDIGLERAAQVMLLASEGDGDHNTYEGAVDSINDSMSRDDMTTDEATVQVGYLGSEAAAFLIAQVNPADGWSSIPYMGVLPAYRGRGLARWVQRHGFSMIRERGGTLYHDGTDAQNVAMIRTFESAGCEVYRRMLNFRWTA